MKQSSEDKKEQLLAEFAAARQAVLDAVHSLPPASRETEFLGTWSAHDIVAHLIGWDQTNLDAARAILAGHLPGFYASYDADWRTYNASLVRQCKQWTIAASVQAARNSHRALMEFLASLTAEDILGDRGVRSPRGRRVTIAMLLTAELNDERKHSRQIADFATTVSSAAEPAE